MLVGHQGVIESLSTRLPPVSIITGPPSVGKRLIAAHAAMTNNISRVDFTEVDRLTVSEAARIKSFMTVSPMQNLKFALIDLDMASSAAVNDLLTMLEAPPEYARFSLISSKRVPRTLITRAYRYPVGLLSSDELMQILLNKGLPESEASKVNTFGRVDLAMQAYSNIASKTTALTILQSALENDYVLFCQAYKAADNKVANIILRIMEESATQNWKLVNPEYIGAFAQKNVALAVLSAWSAVSSAQPQLAVRVALESIMRG